MKVSGNAGSRALLLTAAVVAVSWLASASTGISWQGSVVWKASGIALLALFAFRHRAVTAGIALLCSAAGDVFLDLRPQQMVAGMAAFGIAHVCYALAFRPLINRRTLTGPHLASAAAVLVVSIALLVRFFPGMGSLTVPGLGYHAIITLMVVMAMLSRASIAAKAGAVLFMLSDSLIGFHLYCGLRPPAGSVWTTYAAAQMLLAWSFANSAAES